MTFSRATRAPDRLLLDLDIWRYAGRRAGADRAKAAQLRHKVWDVHQAVGMAEGALGKL